MEQVAALQALTPSGEVAVFVDFDQFVPGQSVDTCGPASVAMVFHAVAPGQHNPYTAVECQDMARADYDRFMGPDVASNHNGTSDQQLYDMLDEHGFTYDKGPADIAWVKERLAEGKIPIIGIVESSVVDNGLGAAPYSWNTTGLTHIITASGAGRGGEILVRDTANIAPTGVRSGPRHYDANRLQLVSATAVHPTWVTNPPPAPPPDPDADVKAAWSAGGFAKAPFVAGHGIPDSYAEQFHAGRYFGFPLEEEQVSAESVEQAFSAGYATWQRATGQTSWKTPAGVVEA